MLPSRRLLSTLPFESSEAVRASATNAFRREQGKAEGAFEALSKSGAGVAGRLSKLVSFESTGTSLGEYFI